jgi:hypothetical protein
MGSHMRAFAGSWIRFVSISVVLSASLTACGGGDSGGSTAQSNTPATPSVSGDENAAPTIAGAAQTKINAGEAYSFKPTAADPDEDIVTFTIANKPAWAAFDPATGLLSGKPESGHVGTYSAVEIAATDGDAVTVLPAFNITVAASAAAKNVSLAWAPPTQNADGTTLTDLSGYKIHYGTASKFYSKSVALTNAGLSRYELDSLPSGKVYIAMTAVNAAGAESDYSQEVTVQVN